MSTVLEQLKSQSFRRVEGIPGWWDSSVCDAEARALHEAQESLFRADTDKTGFLRDGCRAGRYNYNKEKCHNE